MNASTVKNKKRNKKKLATGPAADLLCVDDFKKYVASLERRIKRTEQLLLSLLNKTTSSQQTPVKLPKRLRTADNPQSN